ncbi:enoyl-CoA hydratase-related protein [Candidatus Formimonas warabiya]|uniref:short-chain-enoyl-CoA hydratase n=1 Tax=Formimonas warabiya TaxID=1761012 RepID=A0A3G1L295_FORW1|nr:enoyl-CoA hydratase-related protein [Candidatus Formimonas warabiya]ATW28749.1 hypothetical protein DCMF_19285 [Candidatus Formimonas warabiya]
MNYLICEKSEGIGIITINRPQVLNALNSKVYQELLKTVLDLEADPEVRVIIITGAGGKAFVAGADIAEMKDMHVMEALDFVKLGNQVFSTIEDLTKPVIAAVEGFALGGGCELALACDIRVAGKKAKFGVPEINLGIMPGNGGTQRLPRIIGKAKALEMIWSGAPMGAEEALRMGLVNYVTEAGAALNKAKELGRTFAEKGQIALKAARKAVNYGLSTDIKTGIQYEMALFGGLFSTKDQKEGMEAFLEQRKPNFQNE